MCDKFSALTEDKATLAYQLIHVKSALTVVDAATSFGVGTIYMALTVGLNASAAGIRRRRQRSSPLSLQRVKQRKQGSIEMR